ncbi:MAG TPA: hypothetical protein VJ327_04240 [Patescibacteria group bacterium]|nr:hypothetical protein [Patescibacteria group bacterium]
MDVQAGMKDDLYNQLMLIKHREGGFSDSDIEDLSESLSVRLCALGYVKGEVVPPVRLSSLGHCVSEVLVYGVWAK